MEKSLMKLSFMILLVIAFVGIPSSCMIEATIVEPDGSFCKIDKDCTPCEGCKFVQCIAGHCFCTCSDQLIHKWVNKSF
ncbi:hypothetical protein Scep_018845 [Stephania cephalantha]|uniref:Uncharacterized protein n=1 Tax=Stephania cephalantha TaxID=152367 RepID=A0AAP0NP86_9MAGN